MTNRTPPYPFENWKYRWITPPERNAPDWEAEMRSAASAIFKEFIGSGVRSTKVRSQRQVDIFQFITEGRAHGNPRYSECVDFAGGMLCFLGVRGEGLINRDDDDLDGKKDTMSADTDAPWWNVRGSKLWRMGMNVALLYQGSIKLGAFRRPCEAMAKRGDPFFVDLNTGADHVGVFLTDPVQTSDTTWAVQTGEGGQFDGVGQCCLEYEAVIEKISDKSWTMTRKGKKPRVFSGFVDLTSLKMDAPAIVPPSFTGGFEVEDLSRVVASEDIMSDDKTSAILDDAMETPDSDNPEHLLRLFRETMLDQIRSNRAVTSKLSEMDRDLSMLSSLVRNQSKALSDQFSEINKRISERSEETDTALMEIARELANIRRDQKEEAEARKKQDSIHEDEVTGVKHEIAIVKSEASYAVRTLAMLKETVTTKNVAKGTFLAVVVSVIETVAKNWDKIFP